MAEAYQINARLRTFPGSEVRAVKRNAILSNYVLMLPSAKRELVLSGLDYRRAAVELQPAKTPASRAAARPRRFLASHLGGLDGDGDEATGARPAHILSGAAALTQVMQAVTRQGAAVDHLPFIGPPTTPGKAASGRAARAISHPTPIVSKAPLISYRLETTEPLQSPFGSPARSPMSFSPFKDYFRRLGDDTTASPVRLQAAGSMLGGGGATPKSILGARHTPNRVRFIDDAAAAKMDLDSSFVPAAAQSPMASTDLRTTANASVASEYEEEEITFNFSRCVCVCG